MKSLINLVLLSYNRPEFLTKVIESVLGQSYKKFNFIVIDNGSNTETLRLLESYKKKFFLIKNKQNSKKVFEQALNFRDCKYLSIIHDDDILNPNFLEQNISVLESDINIKFTASCVKFLIDEKPGKIKPFTLYNRKWEQNEYLKTYLYRGNILPFPTLVYRCSILEKINLSFDISKSGPGTDLLHIFRLDSVPGKIILLKNPLYNYRIHSQQDSEKNRIKLEYQIRRSILDHYKEKPELKAKYERASLGIILNIIVYNFFKNFNLGELKNNLIKLFENKITLNKYTCYWFFYSIVRVIRN